MKQIKNKIFILAASSLFVVAIYSCSKEFLERPPIGQITPLTLNNKAGVNGLLIGAYSVLDGTGVSGVTTWNTSVWNPWAGSSSADDAHKGGGYGSQNERAELEAKTYTAQNSVLADKWRVYYAGVQRANEVLRVIKNLPEGEMTAEEITQITAEARFLRGLYHFEAAKMWRNIPYVDESITFSANNYNVTNTTPAWGRIEEDFIYASDNLTPTKAQIGRAHKWAAKSFLAKTYLFQNKLAEAKPILDDIIANGVNASGQKFDLVDQYWKLWRPAFENNVESVFSVQMSVNDGGAGRNGNEGESFNYPPWIMGGWGHQPSFNLVNAYKTENGLPMLDNFNDVDVTHDMGMLLEEPFTPYAGTLDPRLDWTVGRRRMPFHDWGNVEQLADVQGGPFRGKKWVHWKQDEGGEGTEVIDGWQQASGINFDMIRFADVLLWSAEVEVEIGDLQKAEDLVNRVRQRAANPEGFLKKYVNDDPALGFSTTPAANYVINLYAGPTGFVANGKDYARNAVRFERRLELAMEGHRFFDLQRYDLAQDGYMAQILNEYMQDEVAKYETYLPAGQTYQILKGATFVKDKHEIYAIPQVQIDRSKDETGFTLVQNPGHN
jgi:hypothetical protein